MKNFGKLKSKFFFLWGFSLWHFPSTGLSSSKLIGALLFFVEIPSRSTRLVEQLYSAISFSLSTTNQRSNAPKNDDYDIRTIKESQEAVYGGNSVNRSGADGHGGSMVFPIGIEKCLYWSFCGLLSALVASIVVHGDVRQPIRSPQ